MTDQNTNQTPRVDDGIPEALRRTAQPTNKGTQTATPKSETKEQKTARLIAESHNRAVKAKASQDAKTPKAKAKDAKETAKTAKPAKAKHVPADIARTEANPAKSIVPVKFKELYAEHGGSCGDRLATAVKGFIEDRNEDGRVVLSMKKLEQLARDNGVDFSAYQHLNNGQKSMNVRNRLRGLLKAGKKVHVGKQTFADAEKALARPAA